jgi:hypothetical protein
MGRTLDHGDFLNERTYLPTDLPFEKLVSILKRHWFADVSSTVRDRSFYTLEGVTPAVTARLVLSEFIGELC